VMRTGGAVVHRLRSTGLSRPAVPRLGGWTKGRWTRNPVARGRPRPAPRARTTPVRS
jgi:hypothetical protein